MNRTIGLAVVFALVLASVGPAATPTDGPTLPVERLIDQLAHPDFRVREIAARALEAMGPEVLPILRKALQHEDAEVRNRAAMLLPAKERAATLAPRRITLNMPKGTVYQAVAEVARQTGYKIELWPDVKSSGDRGTRIYNFNFDNVPFWDAMDQIASDSGLALQIGWGNDGLRYHFQDSFVPFVHRNGPFRVIAQGFHYGKSNDFANVPRNAGQGYQNNRSEYLNMTLTVVVEPKLPLLGLGQGMVTQAVDENNNSMLVANNNGYAHNTYYAGYRSYTQQTQVPLTLPSKDSRTVKYIRGVLPVTLLVEQKETVVVPNLPTVKDQKFKNGDTEINIQEVKVPAARTVQIKMSLRDTGKDTPNDYSWTNSLYQRVEVHDANGKKYQPQGFNWVQQEPRFVSGTLNFGDPGNGEALGPPARLVYYTWVMLQDQVVFEFKNLPLP